MNRKRYSGERRAVAELVGKARGSRVKEIVLGAELLAAGRALLAGDDIEIARGRFG